MKKKETGTQSESPETPEINKDTDATQVEGKPESAKEAGDASSTTPKEDFKSLYLRSVADLENFRKRVAKDKQDIIKMANGSLIESLLPRVYHTDSLTYK